MKRMKKLISLIAAVVMVLTMTVSASAAGETPGKTTAKVTIKCGEGHTFNAYQIFKGTVDSTGTTIADIEWAEGVKKPDEDATLIPDIQAIVLADGVTRPFAGCSDAASIAEVLSKANDNSETVQDFAEVVKKHKSETHTTSTYSTGTYTFDNLTVGYYLILDEPTPGGPDVTPSSIIVHLIGKDIEIDAKVDVATVSKNAYPDFYNVGDEVEYKLRGTLPSSFDATTSGNEYKYTFEDTFDPELGSASDWEYSNDAPGADGTRVLNKGVKVELQKQETTGEITTDVTDKFKSTWNETNHTLKVSCDNLKALTDINRDSAIVVTYKAKVNAKKDKTAGIDNKVKLYYGEKTTKEAEETVFTLKLVVKMVDGTETTKALNGAEFILSRTVTKDGATTTQYLKTTDADPISWVATAEEATTLTTSGEEGEGEEKKPLGKFDVTGLATGTYMLIEKKAPEGYNKLDGNVEVKISGEAQRNSSGKKVLTSLGVTAGGKDGVVEKIDGAYTGVLTITIANNKGSVLPSTGGMGLTVIYAVGAVLLVGAGILLVTRRRMKTK